MERFSQFLSAPTRLFSFGGAAEGGGSHRRRRRRGTVGSGGRPPREGVNVDVRGEGDAEVDELTGGGESASASQLLASAIFLRYQFFKGHPAGSDDPARLVERREAFHRQQVEAALARRSGGITSSSQGASSIDAAAGIADDPSPPPPVVHYGELPAVVLTMRDLSVGAADRLHRLTYGDGIAAIANGGAEDLSSPRAAPVGPSTGTTSNAAASDATENTARKRQCYDSAEKGQQHWPVDGSAKAGAATDFQQQQQRAGSSAALPVPQRLSLFPLVGLMFCTSIGGSYGLEESLMAGGAFATLLGVIILPIIFALPVALCVAELATSVPSNGGFLTWINVSMSPTLYFFSVIVTLMLTFVDNAAFPVLFADYVCPLAPTITSEALSTDVIGASLGQSSASSSSSSYSCSPAAHAAVKIGTVLVSCGLNLIGIEAVGAASLLITALSVAPFALMFLVHMGRTGGYVNWRNVLDLPFSQQQSGGVAAGEASSVADTLAGAGGGLAAASLQAAAVAVAGGQRMEVNWSQLLPTLTWNVAGLEQAGSIAEDVKDPRRNFIKAALLTIVLSWISYIPPVIAGVSRSSGPEDWSAWVSGYWTVVASDIGGPALRALTVLGSVCSMFGLLLSAVCLTSRLMEGMGESGAFGNAANRILATTGRRFGTPHWSILINTFFTGLCAVLLDFSSLIAIDQALYGIRILMIFLACIKLRYAYPELDRPFKIPVSADGLVYALAVPVTYCMIVTIASAAATYHTLLAFVCLIAAVYGASHVYVTRWRPHGFDGKILPVLVALPGAGLSADSPPLPHIPASDRFGCEGLSAVGRGNNMSATGNSDDEGFSAGTISVHLSSAQSPATSMVAGTPLFAAHHGFGGIGAGITSITGVGHSPTLPRAIRQATNATFAPLQGGGRGRALLSAMHSATAVDDTLLSQHGSPSSPLAPSPAGTGDLSGSAPTPPPQTAVYFASSPPVPGGFGPRHMYAGGQSFSADAVVVAADRSYHSGLSLATAGVGQQSTLTRRESPHVSTYLAHMAPLSASRTNSAPPDVGIR